MSIVKRDPCGNVIRPGDPDYTERDLVLVPRRELEQLHVGFERWSMAWSQLAVHERRRYELLIALGRFIGACQREGSI